MRRALAAAAAAAVVAAAAPPAAAGREAGPRCDAGRTVARSHEVRVFETRGVVWACHRRTRRAIELGPRRCGFASCDVRSIRVVGRYVGYERASAGRYGDVSWGVLVVNARTRRVVRESRTGDAPPDDGGGSASGIGPTTDLELAANGSVAWIAENVFERGSHEVWRLDRRGRSRLDAGPGVAPRSLALSDGWLYWTRDRAAVAADLR
jgi:hypothetical protein